MVPHLKQQTEKHLFRLVDFIEFIAQCKKTDNPSILSFTKVKNKAMREGRNDVKTEIALHWQTTAYSLHTHAQTHTQHTHIHTRVHTCACAHTVPAKRPSPGDPEAQELQESQQLLCMFSGLLALPVREDVIGNQLRMHTSTCTQHHSSWRLGDRSREQITSKTGRRKKNVWCLYSTNDWLIHEPMTD